MRGTCGLLVPVGAPSSGWSSWSRWSPVHAPLAPLAPVGPRWRACPCLWHKFICTLREASLWRFLPCPVHPHVPFQHSWRWSFFLDGWLWPARSSPTAGNLPAPPFEFLMPSVHHCHSGSTIALVAPRSSSRPALYNGRLGNTQGPSDGSPTRRQRHCPQSCLRVSRLWNPAAPCKKSIAWGADWSPQRLQPS